MSTQLNMMSLLDTDVMAGVVHLIMNQCDFQDFLFFYIKFRDELSLK